MEAGTLLPLTKRVAASGRTLAVFTGYTCERLAEMTQSDSAVQARLELVDLLVDGPYIHELKNLELDYRGSGNQRLLGRDDIRAIMERFSSGTYPMEGNAEVSRTREGVGQPVLPSARV